MTRLKSNATRLSGQGCLVAATEGGELEDGVRGRRGHMVGGVAMRLW